MRKWQSIALTAAIAGIGYGTFAVAAARHAGARQLIPDDGNSTRIILTVDATPTAYDQWVNDAVDKLSGDDDGAQHRAADQLALAVVYPPVREKVLAALQPHVNSTNNDFRLRCVKAYGHWATAAQIPILLKIVSTPKDPPNMSGAEPCWAAATAALLHWDPVAARAAMELRTSNFFFRAALTGALTDLTAGNGPDQPIAYDLLKQLDSNNAALQLSVADAEEKLKSDSASERAQGANALIHAVILPGERPAVLEQLKSHLMGSDGRARLPFVQAFARWATEADVTTLEKIVATPEKPPQMNGHENCWAAATVGLLRLDPHAAGEAVKSRSGEFFYRTSLSGFLKPLAEGNSPTASRAAWLLGQLEANDRQPPLPPGFDPDQPSNVVPADAPGERKST